jgi:hypothetical protein
LIDNTDLVVDDSKMRFLGILLKYQLEGRYPENGIDSPEKEISEGYFRQTKEFLEWLIQKL